MTARDFTQLCFSTTGAKGIDLMRLARAMDTTAQDCITGLHTAAEHGLVRIGQDGKDGEIYTLTHYGRYLAGVPVVPVAHLTTEAK